MEELPVEAPLQHRASHTPALSTRDTVGAAIAQGTWGVSRKGVEAVAANDLWLWLGKTPLHFWGPEDQDWKG